MTKITYTVLLYLLLPFTPLKLLWRARKQPEYLDHWLERYGVYKQKPQKLVIWLHCVSVGETRAAAPLVHALLSQYPQHQILLTHTTPTGRATSEQLFADHVMRAYLPYDTPSATHRFLQHFQPQIGLLMETELWFNLIASCKQRSMPLLLINARLSEKSARGYAKLGELVPEGLRNLTAISTQTDQDASRLQDLGASNISILGNLKFDVIPPEKAKEAGHILRNNVGQSRPVLLAASTRDGEEAMILDALAHVHIPNLITVIVPRHPQRFNDVEVLLKKQGCHYVRRSDLVDGTTISQDIKYVLGDSMGEMFTYYAACDVAFIGGSLLPLGGQNLIEAFSMGKPVFIGPHTFNFEQVTKLAIDAGAAIQVQNTDELTKNINIFFARQSMQPLMMHAALEFTAANQGATRRTLALIEQFINPI